MGWFNRNNGAGAVELLRRVSAGDRTAQLALLRLGEEAFPTIRECLGDPSPEIRYAAATVAGDFLNNGHSFANGAILKLKQLASTDPDHIVAEHAKTVLAVAFMAGGIDEAL